MSISDSLSSNHTLVLYMDTELILNGINHFQLCVSIWKIYTEITLFALYCIQVALGYFNHMLMEFLKPKNSDDHLELASLRN